MWKAISVWKKEKGGQRWKRYHLWLNIQVKIIIIVLTIETITNLKWELTRVLQLYSKSKINNLFLRGHL